MNQDLEFPLHSAFLALPLTEMARETFQGIQQQLTPWSEILNFQNPETPHLTLQFWQSLMEIEYTQLLKQAESIAAKSHPFSLEITGADTFGKMGSEKVLFLTVAFSDELARVKKLCPWANVQPFAPHITLARIRHPQKFTTQKKAIMKTLKDIGFTFHFDRIRVYAPVKGKSQMPLADFLFAG